MRPGDAETAIARTHQLLAWQRSLGITIEPSVHAWVAARPALDHAVDVFYLGATCRP